MSRSKKKAQKAKKGLKPQHNKPVSKPVRKEKGAWVILAILVITAIVFIPSLQNEFVNWDDDRNFYENPLITSLTGQNFWGNVAEIFVTPVIGNYNPLPIFTFAIEQQLFGLDQPFYWHLNNLLLHLLCTFLAFRISRLLGLSIIGAGILTLLFGIHPMRVESVAWVTERKDVLFGAFYLGAILYYIKYVQQDLAKKYLIPIYLLFGLALFSKIQAVSLPLSMLCIDYYTGRKIEWKRIIEKIPYFILSLAFGILGVYMLQNEGSLESQVVYPMYVRLFVGTFSYWIYLVKVFVPYELVPLYPYPQSPPWYLYPSIVLLPAILYALYWGWKREKKAMVFGLLFFTVNIMFLLQVLGAGQGFKADRFTYIAYFGLFFIMAYYTDLYLRKHTQYKTIALIALGLIFAIYGYITTNQSKIWKNSGTLWTHVIDHYPKITLPYGNRANYYRDIGYTQRALQDYSTSIRLDGTKAAPLNSRAKLYFNTNNRDSLQLALVDYTQAIQIDPQGEYYINRGAVYARLQNLDQSIQDISKGLEIDPTFTNGYLNRSVVYTMNGQNQKAIADMKTYLNYDPNNNKVWMQMGIGYHKQGQMTEAIEAMNKGIALNNRSGTYYVHRAKLHYDMQNRDAAVRDVQQAQQLGHQVDKLLLSRLGM